MEVKACWFSMVLGWCVYKYKRSHCIRQRTIQRTINVYIMRPTFAGRYWRGPVQQPSRGVQVLPRLAGAVLHSAARLQYTCIVNSAHSETHLFHRIRQWVHRIDWPPPLTASKWWHMLHLFHFTHQKATYYCAHSTETSAWLDDEQLSCKQFEFIALSPLLTGNWLHLIMH